MSHKNFWCKTTRRTDSILTFPGNWQKWGNWQKVLKLDQCWEVHDWGWSKSNITNTTDLCSVQLQWWWHPRSLCLQGLIVKPISHGRQQGSSRQMAQLTYKMLNQVDPCATSTSNHLAIPICKPTHRSQRRPDANLRSCHRQISSHKWTHTNRYQRKLWNIYPNIHVYHHS